MIGEGWRTSLVSRRLPVALIGLVAVAFLASPASALNLTAHTNRGGTCRLHTIASRTGDQIKYGVKVSDCSTRFGVRYAISQGALYDRTDGLPVDTGYLHRKKAGIPYSNQRRVGGTHPSHPYRTRIDVSIVLKTRRNRATRRPERWLDPGSRCRVETTDHNGDTLGCELGDSLPPA